MAAIPPSLPLLSALARNWWLLVLRGVVAILFGVLAFVWPGVTLVSLALLYGVFAFADGLLALIAAIRGGSPQPRWWLAVAGLVGVGAGLLTFIWPGMTALILLYLIAGWAIATGVVQIVGAIRLRKEIDNEWWLIAAGALSVLFGLVMFARPGAGALAVLFTIGAFAIVYGVFLVAFALRVRRHSGVV